MSDAGPGHNSAVPREQLKSIIERVEKLEEEKKQTASAHSNYASNNLNPFRREIPRQSGTDNCWPVVAWQGDEGR